MEAAKKSKRKVGKIFGIIGAVLVVLLIGADIFAGNFLFNFALNPNASYTMNDMMTGEAARPAAAEAGPDEDEAIWRVYCAQANERFSADAQPVTLERPDGSVRRGSYFPGDGHQYALVFHGYSSHSGHMAGYVGMFRDMGMAVLAPDALAHGKSDGDYVGMGWLERDDVLGWIGTIVEKDPQAEIVLFGVSMGGATVMMASGEDLPPQVKCIVEDCGYSSVWDEFSVQLKQVFGLPSFPLLHTASVVTKLRAGYSFWEASSVKQLKKATLPMLFIHGEEDTFVPYSMLDVVYEACASEEKEKLSVPGAVHGAAADTDPVGYWTAVENFVGRYMELNIEE